MSSEIILSDRCGTLSAVLVLPSMTCPFLLLMTIPFIGTCCVGEFIVRLCLILGLFCSTCKDGAIVGVIGCKAVVLAIYLTLKRPACLPDPGIRLLIYKPTLSGVCN